MIIEASKPLCDLQPLAFEPTDLRSTCYTTADYDMVAVCNFLGISYKKDDMFLHIFTNLRKGMSLKSVVEAEDDEDSKDGNKDDDKDDTRSNACFNSAFSQKSKEDVSEDVRQSRKCSAIFH